MFASLSYSMIMERCFPEIHRTVCGEDFSMKKLMSVIGAILLFTGCATMGQFLGEPEIRLKGMAIEGLDLEGITFRCDYTVKNPYPVGITVSQVATDVSFEETQFVSLVTDEGLNLAAASTNRNSILFTVPYESLWNLAGESRDRESLPFSLDGTARFDLSAVPMLENQSLSVPYHLDFEVPLFKPEFRITGGKVVMPSLQDVTKALVAGGMNILKAGINAGRMIAGEPVEQNVFEDIDLDVTILFDLNVQNRGGAPWVFDLKQCRVDTGLGSLVDMELRNGSGKIDGSGDSLQMAAVLNTREWGAFLAGLAAGRLSGSALVLESSLTFPGLPYEAELPLNINQDLSLGAFRFGTE